MKRLGILALCIAFLLSFASCGKEKNEIFSLSPFSGEVSIMGENIDYLLDLSFEGSDKMAVMVKNPDGIGGVTYTKTGEKIIYSKGDTVAETEFLSGSEKENVVAVLFCIFDEMSKKKYTFAPGESTFEDTCALGSFTFEKGENGKPLRITFGKFKFKFC